MKIKMLAMDVDGTLTDGKIYFADSGEIFKVFNVKDGYMLHKCDEYGIITVIITGRESKIVKERAKELKINEVYQKIYDKPSVLKSVAEKYGLSLSEVAYIGDDLNDLECIKLCGLSACPFDAVDEVKKSVSYVCEKNGGDGAVREFIDFIVKNN